MNFDIIKDNQDFQTLYGYCSQAEIQVFDNPSFSAICDRNALETLVKAFYCAKYGTFPEGETLFQMIVDGRFSGYLDDAMLSSIHYVRKIGNNAAHCETITKGESVQALKCLYYSVCEILTYLGAISDYPDFDVEESKKHPRNEIEKAPDSVQEDDPEKFQKYKNSIEEKAKIQAKKALSEADTRKAYVDLALKEAGWTVSDSEHSILPGKASVEVEITGMPSQSRTGYADYVLFDVDGKPLAVIEAKRTSVDEVVGSQQAKLYADCLEKMYGIRPVIFYTNGYKIMMIDGCGYPARRVFGFYTLGELHSLITRRGLNNISDTRIDPNISDRPFIQNAATAVAEAFNNRQRKALLVMATGTGKTRCAISVVDVLQRCQWVKHVLFLADRTALVTQAARSFEKFLPHSSRCILSEITEEKRDYSARIVLSTYNTISNIIDRDDRTMGVGQFDLIIIDECHRSVYNKYKAIFSYFDALLLGLTATPREQVDASTYELFDLPKGEPTFYYDYDTAIKSGYLVPFMPIERTTNLLKNGLNYDKLSAEDKEKFEITFGDPAIDDVSKTIDGKAFYERIINDQTIDVVLQTLMNEGLRVKSGEELGKSIIFAVNHFHAEKIVERFNVLYPKKGPNYCRLIDNTIKYVQSSIDEFSIKDKEPIIAVSVDMLDTGVDVPEVLNLVFFKRVYSKIKFWQMIGRGTRVCKELEVVSPSEDFFLKKEDEGILASHMDKQGFYIFDFCDVFEFFRMNPDGREPRSTLNLSQKIFNLKLEILYSLQSLEHQESPEHKAYYDKTKKELINCVSGLDRHLVNVRHQLKYVDKYSEISNWDYLTVLSINEIKKQITPIIDPTADEETSKIFDVCLFNIELAFIQGDKDYSKAVQKVTTLCQSLLDTKTTIPTVATKKDFLKEICTSEYWENLTIERLEKVRIEVRDLLMFLERSEYQIISSNFDDQIIVKPDGPVIIGRFKNYNQRVIDYLFENQRLPVIEKIMNMEQLNPTDANDLETILWKELGTKEEFDSVSNGLSVAAFVRRIVGLSKESVNSVLNGYLQEYSFNAKQQEFLNQIVQFVLENGDIQFDNLVESEPFKSQDYTELFNGSTNVIYDLVARLHNSICFE